MAVPSCHARASWRTTGVRSGDKGRGSQGDRQRQAQGEAMDEEDRGWREIEHTADWAMEVWAPNLEELLEQAARGMYGLAETVIEDGGGGDERAVTVDAIDREDLVVSFLSELLFLAEMEGVALEAPRVQLVGERRLEATGRAAPIAKQSKAIKAVTYHGVEVVASGEGLRVRVVFDV